MITNVDLFELVDTSDQWIRDRTGIVERRILEEGASPATWRPRLADALARRQDSPLPSLMASSAPRSVPTYRYRPSPSRSSKSSVLSARPSISQPASRETVADRRHFVKMNGKSIFTHAVKGDASLTNCAFG